MPALEAGQEALEPPTRPSATDGMPWRQARRVAFRSARPLGVETLPVAAAAGRVLAANVHSALMLPSHDTAAMDGYAVAGPGPWLVVGRCLAGHPGPQRVLPGTALEIATGAVVPAGVDAVVPYEQCHSDGATVVARSVERR